MTRKFLFLVIFWLISGCMTIPRLVWIDVEIKDDPANERIELEYMNRSKNTMCLSTSYWPYEGNGLLDDPGERIVLIAGAARFFMQEALIGYSVGGDDKRVFPGKSITSYMRYKSFRLPDDLRYAKKKLIFPAMGYRCR